MRTIETIYYALTENLARSSGAAITEGGDMSLRLRAVAAELFSLEAQADFVTRQSFPQTAEGTYLDCHAELRGLVRGSACKAAGQLRFYLDGTAASTLVVPSGTECRTAAGTAFVTTETGVITAGNSQCTVAAEAAIPGSGGNVPAEAVSFVILPPAGVAGVVNDAAFSGGSDGESDENLRSRILSSYRRLPNGANAAYYENKVLEYPGAAAAEVLPRNRGIGTVDVIFAMAGGVPTTAQVADVQAMLDAEREICVDVRVQAPTTATVNVTASLTVAEGRNFAEVSAAANAAIAGFFTGELLGRPVYKAKLEALLMSVDGVENCRLTAPASDVAAASGKLPVKGTVSISEAV